MTWFEIIQWSIYGGTLAFMICSAARSSRRSKTVTMSFEAAMAHPDPLLIPDCQIGDPVRDPGMVGDVMNTAAARLLIRERQGC